MHGLPKPNVVWGGRHDMFYVYVLHNSETKANYIGYTGNLKERITQHNRGNTRTTRDRNIHTLIFYEAFKSKDDAMRREHYFKTTKGNSSLKQIIRESLI